MSRLGVPLRAAALAALLRTSSSATVPASSLFGRADASCAAGYSYCGSSLPSFFCCPSTGSCQILAGKTTVVCCPAGGGTCDSIEPISCLLDQEDGQAHPTAVVKTTALTGRLSSCGGACCPFGYSCSNDNVCVKNANQDAAPSTSAAPSSTSSSSSSSSLSSSSSSSSSSSTSRPTRAAATTASAGSTSNTSAKSIPSPSSGLSTAAIAGVCIAAVLAILVIALIVWWIQKRKNKHRPASSAEASDKRETVAETKKREISKPFQTDEDGRATTRFNFIQPPGSAQTSSNGGHSRQDSFSRVSEQANSMDGLVAGAAVLAGSSDQGNNYHRHQKTAKNNNNNPFWQQQQQQSPPPPQGSPEQPPSYHDYSDQTPPPQFFPGQAPSQDGPNEATAARSGRQKEYWESRYESFLADRTVYSDDGLLTPSPLRLGNSSENTRSPGDAVGGGGGGARNNILSDDEWVDLMPATASATSGDQQSHEPDEDRVQSTGSFIDIHYRASRFPRASGSTQLPTPNRPPW